jgi:hypothetical protein
MDVGLSLSSRVRISETTLVQELGGEAVLLELSRGVYYGLDAIGTRIWNLLADGRTVDEAVAALVEEYDVTSPAAAADVLGLVRELQERRLLEIDG